MNGAPRVLILTETHGMYGAEQWAAAAANGLVAAGMDVTMAQPRPGASALRLHPAVRHLAYDVFDLPDPAGWIEDRGLAAAIIAEVRPDVAVVSCGTVLSNLGARLEVLARGVPLISVNHLGGEVGFDLPCPAARRADVATVLNGATAAVGVSAAVVTSLREHYGLAPDRGVVVVNGRPDVYFQPSDPRRREPMRRQLGVGDDELMILTIARVHPAKGYQHQLAAIEILRGRPVWQRLQFRWVGGTEALRRLRALVAARRLGNRVQLLGERGDVPDLLDAADVFVLPSSHEGHPLAIIEAMAKRLAVVTTRVGGIPELVGDAAVLLDDPRADPAGTATALAEAIAALATDPQRRVRLGSAAHERVLRLGRESTMVDAYASLVRRVLDSSVG